MNLLKVTYTVITWGNVQYEITDFSGSQMWTIEYFIGIDLCTQSSHSTMTLGTLVMNRLESTYQRLKSTSAFASGDINSVMLQENVRKF